MLVLEVTNHQNHVIHGEDVYIEAVVADDPDHTTYPGTYWTGGPMAARCPENVESVAPGRTATWRTCFEMPAGEKPDLLDFSVYPKAHIVQFHSYSAGCADVYGERLCAPYVLDGRLTIQDYIAICADVGDVRRLADCWRETLVRAAEYILLLEERVDGMIYESAILYPAVHRTTIKETEIQWEFYDSKDNYYAWTLPVSAYEDAVYDSRYGSEILSWDPLYLNLDGKTIPTTNLDGFVVGYFGEVIGDVYDNSHDDADFVREVWHIATQLTVYDEDVHAHSEGRYATETFSRGGGDCEDLVILVADILVSFEHTEDWIIQYVYMDADNPTDPQGVNHLILYVDDGNSTHLIEATGEPGHDYPDGVNG